MSTKYDIESLIKTFEIHAEKAEAQRQISLEANPDCEWAKEDFNFSKALAEMCKEIKDLKKDMS